MSPSINQGSQTNKLADSTHTESDKSSPDIEAQTFITNLKCMMGTLLEQLISYYEIYDRSRHNTTFQSLWKSAL